MVLAARLSERLGYLRHADVERIERAAARARGCPCARPTSALARYLELMGHDKKVAERAAAVHPAAQRSATPSCGEAPDAALAELLSGPAVHA